MGRAAVLRRLMVVSTLVFGWSLGFAANSWAATDTVMNLNDSGAGSLRAVIAAAGAGDTVVFASGLTGTINISGAMPISKNLTIQGPGASALTINPAHTSRIFFISNGSVSISGLTLANGADGGTGGSAADSGQGNGGAIYDQSSGSLSLSDTIFTGNTAGGAGGSGTTSGYGQGGAIFDIGGQVSVSDSTFTGNTAGGAGGTATQSGGGEGGAIFDINGTVSVSDSTFTGNTAGGAGSTGAQSGQGMGGAIEAFSLTASGSTFANDKAGGVRGDGALAGWGTGGAVWILGGSISDSTLNGNAAGGTGGEGEGGAIYDVTSPLTLAGATIDRNSVGSASVSKGAGIFGASHATAHATIVSDNTGAANCDAAVSSSSYSLSSDSSCGFDLPPADPQLGPLADNGGPTETQALPLGSPAVYRVPTADCPTSTDQRGDPRKTPFCDVGAYELQGVAPPAITSGPDATFQAGHPGSFTITGTGSPNPSLTESGALPSGVTLTDNHNGTATLAGTPANGTAGTYHLTISASNGVGAGTAQSFTLTIIAAPTQPSAHISILTRSTQVIKGKAKVKLSCTGATCRGTLKLTIRQAVKTHGKKHAYKTIVLAKASYTITAGKTKTITLKLTSKAQRLLSAAHKHRLTTTATATLQGGRTTGHALTLKRVARL